MSNMKRALMFTAYEFIIRVTPRASGSKLALSEKKTEDHSTLDPTVFRCSGGFYSAKSNVKKLPIFSQSEDKHHYGTSARQYYASKWLHKKLSIFPASGFLQ